MITVSIHDDKCTTLGCPHKNECYLVNRHSAEGYISSTLWTEILNKCSSEEAVAYASLCDTFGATSLLTIAQETPHFSVTLGYSTYISNKEHCDTILHKLQITVYTLSQILELEHAQKLFFIKDKETLAKAIVLIEEKIPNIHFPVKRNTFSTIELLSLMHKVNNASDTVTLDSCLEHAILHKDCIYAKNYVDIQGNGTYRRCPFDIDGLTIGNKTISDMLSDTCSNKCQFTQEFAEE